VASLNVHSLEITQCACVDALCFGGTKNGLLVEEVMMCFDKALAKDFAYRVK